MNEKKIGLEIDYQPLDITIYGDDISLMMQYGQQSVISLGDTNHRFKHQQSISITPIVFGKAVVGEPVLWIKVSWRIFAAIERDDMALYDSQPNNPVSALYRFFICFAGQLDIDDGRFAHPDLRADIKALLSGVNRSSGSPDWLKDIF